MKKLITKTTLFVAIITSMFFVFSCEKETVAPITQKDETAIKAMNLASKGLDSLGQFQFTISYRSPLSGEISKGILAISSTNGYSKKVDFNKPNFDLDISLKDKGQYSVSILEISKSGHDYTETGEINIK